MSKKPTYKLPVATCAIILIAGAIILAILMETRDMAPPRKYEVDMSGEVIGIDNGPKTPVLTKEEIKEEEIKEEARPKPVKAPEPKVEEEPAEPEQPIIVPSLPEGQTEPAPIVRTPQPEIEKPEL